MGFTRDQKDVMDATYKAACNADDTRIVNIMDDMLGNIAGADTSTVRPVHPKRMAVHNKNRGAQRCST